MCSRAPAQRPRPFTREIIVEHRSENDMVTRREWLGITVGAGATLGMTPRLLSALQQGTLIQRAIPSSGERLPVVGLGSAYSFSDVARREDVEALREVIKTLVEKNGKVLDTAPGYGASEEVSGRLASELGVSNKIFWATKVNVAGRGAGGADPARARAQIDQSFARLKVAKVDLIQVHNLGDVPTQLGILKELKKGGRVRYIGVTSTSNQQYPQLEQIMRNEPLDFIGLDYAVDNRDVEEKILPLALERKIGVLAYLPFGRTRLFSRVQGKEVPDWAHDFDAHTWAQFFLKYVVSHPAITCATPGTSQAKHMVDNMGGAVGRLPDEATRKKMAQFVDALPAGG
jgi:aryl-alcohol dehydrogenase-like predicted oxidoreductase